MNIDELNFIGKLDPDGANGSIQVILQDHKDMEFTEALKTIAQSLVFQLTSYKKENKMLNDILKRHELYESEVLGLK